MKSELEEAAIKRFFRLDFDWNAVVRRLTECHPGIEPIVEKFPGLRPLRIGNAESVLFSFLCSANNNIARITKMVHDLERLGEQIENAFDLECYTFPDVATIGSKPEAFWRDRRFGYRAAYLTQLCRELEKRPKDLFISLKDADIHSASAVLESLPGIGPKVAACIALYGLHLDDAVPVDVHMWRSYLKHFAKDRSETFSTKHHRIVGDVMRDKFGKLAGWAQLFYFCDQLSPKA